MLLGQGEVREKCIGSLLLQGDERKNRKELASYMNCFLQRLVKMTWQAPEHVS